MILIERGKKRVKFDRDMFEILENNSKIDNIRMFQSFGENHFSIKKRIQSNLSEKK